MITTKSKYNIALNDIGLILQGTPLTPAYALEQAPVFQNRFAQGDRTYDDFSKWWYWAQTDWSNGFKNDLSWADDGKFYYSTNIDAYSEIGSVKLALKQTLYNTFGQNALCGIEGTVDPSTPTVNQYIGTDTDGNTNKAIIWRYNGATWDDISSSQFSTNRKKVSQLNIRASYLWYHTVGNANGVNTDSLGIWTGTAFYEQGAILNGLGIDSENSRCGVSASSGIYYAFVDVIGTTPVWAMIKTSVLLPTAGGDWTILKEVSGSLDIPIACTEFVTSIYYLLYNSQATTMELRKYDPATSTDISIWTFQNTAPKTYGVGGKYLKVIGDKLIITVPAKEIWSYDGVAMTRIFKQDANKTALGKEADALLDYGCVLVDNKLRWGNLVYDIFTGNLFNDIKDTSDSTSYYYYHLFVDGAGVPWGTDTNQPYKVYKITTGFKGTADKNFIVFNNFDKVSGIDKLSNSVTILFKKLITGQKIVVEYFTGELASGSSWTALGNVNYTSDGGTVTEKTFFFPVNTTFKKIWVRVKLEGGGSDTPTLQDYIFAYLPRPFSDKRWRFNIDCGDNIKLLNGSMETNKGRQIKAKLEQTWLLNQVIDFQDVDYATTTITTELSATDVTSVIVADTSDFPEVGRLKIQDEVIYYTGKTQKSFTGLYRGQKKTMAVVHAAATTVDNGYKVLIESINANVPILNREKEMEYVVGMVIREII